MNPKWNLFDGCYLCHVCPIEEKPSPGVDVRVGIIKECTDNAGIVLENGVSWIAVSGRLIRIERDGKKISPGKACGDICFSAFVLRAESCRVGQQVSVFAECPGILIEDSERPVITCSRNTVIPGVKDRYRSVS